VTALAVGAVAAVAATSGRVLVAASRDATGTALALERVEGWRAGPRIDGTDVVAGADGTAYARRWATVAGRGHADTVEAITAWPSHAIVLATGALP
jgi:hypothetical protein